MYPLPFGWRPCVSLGVFTILDMIQNGHRGAVMNLISSRINKLLNNYIPWLEDFVKMFDCAILIIHNEFVMDIFIIGQSRQVNVVLETLPFLDNNKKIQSNKLLIIESINQTLILYSRQTQIVI